MMVRYATAILISGIAAMAATPYSNVTYYKDVLPIMQKNCQSCHRPGEIAPTSFLTYESTRPWAEAIKEAVLTKQMPPSFTDLRFRHFANERRLSEADIKTLAAWVDVGAPPGDPMDEPPPNEWLGSSNLLPKVGGAMPASRPVASFVASLGRAYASATYH